jgi:uncharacterized glyoxalase superfamily protein PhnB
MNESTRPNIFPALRYRDADAALAWLQDVFGFEEKAIHRGQDGVIHHAEVRLGAGLVMFGQRRDDVTTSIYATVDDPDAHYERARAAGAEIVRELAYTDYGSREYSARDLDGNLWSFGSYDPYAAQ